MMILTRRMLVVGMAPGVVAACEPSQPQPPHSDIIFVSISPTQSGYATAVDGVPIELADLDAAVLAAALEANAGMTEQQARADVMIALTPEPGTPYQAVRDVMNRLRFERVIFVGEDGRS